MADLLDGEYRMVRGDSGNVYTIHRNGDVYSCSCPSWLHQPLPLNKRTCKHLKDFRGENAENERVGKTKDDELPSPPKKSVKEKTSKDDDSDGMTTENISVMLAETWDWEKDPTGWLMSEKLDGIRAVWDGKNFWTRNGNKIFAPEWFSEGLPNEWLDGELWVGRGQGKFQECSSIVRKQGGSDEDWKKVEYRVFDAPNHKGTFRERIEYLKTLFESNPPHASLIMQVPCKSKEFLLECLAITVREHGEGIIIRDPDSEYVHGRSNLMLKVKPLYDAEARITGYTDGKGKYSGMIGAFIVEMPNGKTFNLSGMNDEMRKNPPPIGTIITYQYRDISKDGIPRHASFLRIREDLNWEDLVKGKTDKTIKEEPKGDIEEPKEDIEEDIEKPKKIDKEESKKSKKITKPKPTKSHIKEDYIYNRPKPYTIEKKEFIKYFESKDKLSFWNITVKGKTVTCHYGKKGCNGTKVVSKCISPEDANKKIKKC